MDWRQCAGFPDYEVSDDGRVRRLTHGSRRYRAGYTLTAKRHPRGYLCYSLKRPDGSDATMLAHRLVALTFLGEPPSDRHEVAHADGTRTNNQVANLRWALPAENQADRREHGTWHEGEVCGSAVLTDEQAEEIRAAYADGGSRYRGGSVTMQALADRYGVSVAQVSRIVNGKQRVRSAPPSG